MKFEIVNDIPRATKIKSLEAGDLFVFFIGKESLYIKIDNEYFFCLSGKNKNYRYKVEDYQTSVYKVVVDNELKLRIV